MGGHGARHGWPGCQRECGTTGGLAAAAGSLRHDLALKEASREPAGRRPCHPAFDTTAATMGTGFTTYLLPTTYYLLPTTYCLLPTAYCLLPTAYCLLLTTYYLLLLTTCYLLVGEYARHDGDARRVAQVQQRAEHEHVGAPLVHLHLGVIARERRAAGK